jgi:hypothetical protein
MNKVDRYKMKNDEITKRLNRIDNPTWFDRLMVKIKPPGPKALGKSKCNALPSKRFYPFEEKYSWEDWTAEVKRDYPIRYFIGETIPHLFAVYVIMRLRNWKWKIIDWFRRPHLLDLRNQEYGGGYIDPRQAMLYANFKLLEKYIKSGPYDLRKDYTEEEIDSRELRDQQDYYDEAHELYKYWKVGRGELEAADLQLYYEMDHAGKIGNKEKWKAIRKEWMGNRQIIENTEDEMLMRLIRIRRGLWV